MRAGASGGPAPRSPQGNQSDPPAAAEAKKRRLDYISFAASTGFQHYQMRFLFIVTLKISLAALGQHPQRYSLYSPVTY